MAYSKVNYGVGDKKAVSGSNMKQIEDNIEYVKDTHKFDISRITENETHKVMTKEERTRLAGIEENANYFTYTHPPSHTKSFVGLGNVENYGIATKTEAESGTSNTKYMTPLRVKEYVSSLGLNGDSIGGTKLLETTIIGYGDIFTVTDYFMNYKYLLITAERYNYDVGGQDTSSTDNIIATKLVKFSYAMGNLVSIDSDDGGFYITLNFIDGDTCQVVYQQNTTYLYITGIN